MATFKEIGVSDQIIKALLELNIEVPSDIQQQVLPVLLKNKIDIIAQAQTGTGKTAAFAIPILEQIDISKPYIQTLILSPTRELGQQIGKQIFKMSKYSGKVFSEVVFGGEHIGKQMERLQRPTHILVATPGRLIDLLQRKAVNLKNITTLVLDEADEMLNRGFRKEVDEILLHTEGQRNTWLFSATMPSGVLDLVKLYMSKDALHIKSEKKKVINPNIEHQYIMCEIEEKVTLLTQFIKDQGAARGVVFCKTKAGASKLVSQLVAKNISADAIHGDLLQKERDKVMRAFKNKKVKVLIATDVAARGIDIEDLAYVIHYQLPEQLENYTHRSGRTARAGKKGLSVSFLLHNEIKKIRELEADLGITFFKIKR